MFENAAQQWRRFLLGDYSGGFIGLQSSIRAACLLVVADTFGLELPSTFTTYYLRRVKEGTEVSITGGRLTLNLSHAAKTYPPNFKAARKWIAAMADRFGWQMTEVRGAVHKRSTV